VDAPWVVAGEGSRLEKGRESLLDGATEYCTSPMVKLGEPEVHLGTRERRLQTRKRVAVAAEVVAVAVQRRLSSADLSDWHVIDRLVWISY
jgi:hypothetical protein